jgi:hypothetical protein
LFLEYFLSKITIKLNIEIIEPIIIDNKELDNIDKGLFIILVYYLYFLFLFIISRNSTGSINFTNITLS